MDGQKDIGKKYFRRPFGKPHPAFISKDYRKVAMQSTA
jgi:hypothetical protein